jgi:hypothetical protein
MERVADWRPRHTDQEELIVWTEADSDYVDLAFGADSAGAENDPRASSADSEEPLR